jgi:hypothetical protein
MPSAAVASPTVVMTWSVAGLSTSKVEVAAFLTPDPQAGGH